VASSVFQIEGRAEILCTQALSGDGIVVAGWYEGEVSLKMSRGSSLELPLSRGSHDVASGFVIRLNMVNESLQVQWIASIRVKFFSSSIRPSQCALLEGRSLLALTSFTTTSSIQFVSTDGTVSDLSVVVGTLGDILSLVDIDSGM
jgi:hypothetical protein